MKFDDDYKALCRKIGSRATSKSEGPDNANDIVYWFLTSTNRIIVRQKEGKAIQFVRVFPIGLREIKSIELKKSLKSQNNNISLINNEQILRLKEHLPTIDWKQSMLKGDRCFTEKGIADAGEVFNLFIEQLIIGCNKKDAAKIYSALKKATIAFNNLQNRHNGIIETLEREQIIIFFEKGIKLTGFQIAEGLDLTQDIREW
ncbi:MAG: hypothetical protein WKI04_09770 [Ferruginibacter sp.]